MNFSQREQKADLALIEPSAQYESSFRDMVEEWEASGEKMAPFVLRMDMNDFESYVRTLRQMKTEPTDGRKTVNSSTFWLTDGRGRVLGAVNIRHALNEHLLKIGGHITFGIRPSERGKGYAKRMLELAMEEARKLNLSRVLIVCGADHEAARRTILSAGGVRENQTFFNGKMYDRYWIDLKA
jgi:predicted acetyltransferase